MPKANGVPTATGSVSLDTKLSQMKNDIYSQVIGETRTQLKSLDTQLRDGLDGQIKKAVNEQQDSQDRVSQVMSKIKAAIQTSEAHTKSDLAAQITQTVKSEVAKAMASFKESQTEARSLEPFAPAPALAPREDINERLEIVEEQVESLSKIVLQSLKVIDNILLDWGKQLDTEMEAKRHAFEEGWRDEIDYTQQALTVQVDNLTDTITRLNQLSLIVSRMRQGTSLETTDLTNYRDEPPEEVWPGLTDTPARALQQTHVKQADTSIIDFDSASDSEAGTEKDEESGGIPQSFTDWFAGPSLPTPRDDGLLVDVAEGNDHHVPDIGPAQIKPHSTPALITNLPYVDTAEQDRHHDPVSGFKASLPSVHGRYIKVDPEGICLRG